MNTQNLHKAVFALYPNAVAVYGDSIDSLQAVDEKENNINIDKNSILAWKDLNAYKANRAAEYPPIGDQLDALFHAGVFPPEMAALIQAVKDKYPKEQS